MRQLCFTYLNERYEGKEHQEINQYLLKATEVK